MREPARDFLLGLTTLAAAIGLSTLLMLFGELDRLIKPRYALTINTDNAAGLRAGSAIELNGVPIGVVNRIVTRPDPQFPVQVVALIGVEERIPSDVVPYATSSLLGGSATLQLEAALPEVGAPAAFLATDGSARIDARIGSRLVEQIRTELDNYIAPLVELAGNLNALLRAPEAGDPEEARWNLRTAVENLNAALEQLAGLGAALESRAGEVTTALLPVLDELAARLEELRSLTLLATEGEGTVAQLLNNPDLYESLTEAARQLDRALLQFELLAEQLKTEGFRLESLF
ncbi:MAG: MlaD family protein [Planctomycetota bacterium]|jgi:phospholipid/cholesterol/gamma-HCH transport system substrate-binding protein